jgi:hypothetical protein
MGTGLTGWLVLAMQHVHRGVVHQIEGQDIWPRALPALAIIG